MGAGGCRRRSADAARGRSRAVGTSAAATAGQIGLPFDWPAARPDEHFFVTDANRVVARHFDRIADAPVMATLLTGPRLSGRTLLGRQVAARTGGRLFDRVEDHDEEAVFHAWNHAQEVRRPLILIADHAPPVWTIRLPDLASRIAATPHVEIGEPDDALFAALLAKLLGARGLAAPADLASFLLGRVERSYLAIHRIVEALDADLMARRGRLTVNNARRALAAAGIMDAAGDIEAAGDKDGSIPHG